MSNRNLLVAAFVVFIVIFIIVPIPDFLLDVLLVINITLSLLILINSIYATDALSMASFPTMLLFATMYRLSLNIVSTRLIIGKGEAGEVIKTFGEFVGGNDLVVGFIVYIIIMLAQFIVITKGSERVAEVSARFTLDAMPGKQMAIDADLNSGLINETEAKERRKKIQREADFYGSMDGAAKFVKNDAIFGIITTAVNILGGIIMGMVAHGDTIEEALKKYTILTIGDGLVSQIPALLISVATGIIVTRAASDGDLGGEMVKQIFSSPQVLYIGAGACLILVPILKQWSLIVVAAGLAFLAQRIRNKVKEASKQEEIKVEEQEVEEIRKPENVVSLLHVDPIELEFGYAIIPLADKNQGGDLLDRVVMIRRQLALELGVIVPIIRLRDNIQLSPNQYVIKIKGVEVASGELILDHFMAMNPRGISEDEIKGIPTTEPAFGLPAMWIPESMRDRAEMLGFTVVDPPSIVATHMTEIIRRHIHELLTRQDVQTLIDNVKTNNPAIVDELVPKIMSLGEIQKVLANLLREGVSIRDMTTILETLADFAPVTRDTDMLTEYVRQSLGRAISKSYLNGGSEVITLDPKVEKIILDSVQKTEAGSYMAMDPSISNRIISKAASLAEKMAQKGKQPVILASPVVRLYFKRLTENAIPGLVVLSYNELDPTIDVNAVDMVTI